MDAPTIHIPRQSGEFQIPAFDAVIPATVRYDSRLSGDAKILYAEVRALTNAYGFCWAGDDYFCNLFNVSYKTIGRWLAQLEDAGHIVITKERDDTDGKLYRIIRLSEAVQGPLEQKMDKVVQNSGQSCPKKMDKSVHSNSNNKYIKNINARARVTQKKSTVKNQFNNFSQRNYNMDQLEAAIINRPMRASP